MGIFLILVLFVQGMPVFDFLVFQDMKECLKTKAKIEIEIEKQGLNKPLYLECKSDEGEKQRAEQ